MALLKVEDFPEDIYRKIHRSAKKEKRTVAQQTIVIIRRGLSVKQSNIERRKKLLESINKREITNDVNKIDDLALIRADRNR